MKHVLVIHNVRSAHNVGSLFRTADGAGIEMIYLVGCTPLPIDRFERKNKEIAKTALGAETIVPWKHVRSFVALLKELHNRGFQVIALEQTSESKPLFDHVLIDQWALVVGNEVEGIPEKHIALCDVALEIPMRGKKESLNVSVAGGIALYYLSRAEKVPMS